MTAETYDDLKRYVGSKNDFTDDLIKYGYTKGRADEREKIVSMIEEIAHCTLYCMADMCDREDKNCEKCGLEYVINRTKEQK